MTEPQQPQEGSQGGISDETVRGVLRRALRITLMIGLLGALIVWKAAGLPNAAMLATGTLISAASILEWGRLIRFINAQLDKKQAPRGTAVAIVFFLIRLAVFAGAIYGSLKWIHGSAVALLCGLALAVLALLWEALRLLRN